MGLSAKIAPEPDDFKATPSTSSTMTVAEEPSVVTASVETSTKSELPGLVVEQGLQYGMQPATTAQVLYQEGMQHDMQSATTAQVMSSVASGFVRWQWEHKTGWKEYDLWTTREIESAYISGKPFARVKSGKDGKAILEIFFAEKVQHDPKTKNIRNIRRLGAESFYQKWMRHFREWVVAVQTGRPYRMTLQHYRNQQRHVFGALNRADFDVSDLYKDPATSRTSRITQSPAFLVFSALVIAANTVWLGIDADFNQSPTVWEATMNFQIAEHTFCILFFIDILMRFCSLKHTCSCFKDFWLLCDFVLVFMMLLETYCLRPISLYGTKKGSLEEVKHLSAFRTLRLVRLTRLAWFARLVHFSPELFTMLKGIMRATLSVFYTASLLVLLVYITAIMFKIKAEAHPELQEQLGTVGDAMWFLLLHGTFLDDITGAVGLLRKESHELVAMLMLFSFITSLTLLNMLVGILCDVVARTKQGEEELAAIETFKSHLLPLLVAHDVNNTGRLGREEFELVMTNPDACLILAELGVDAQDFHAMQGRLFDIREEVFRSESMKDEDSAGSFGPPPPDEKLLPTGAVSCPMAEISFAEFMDVALRLRGGNQSKVKDIVELREYIKNKVEDLVPIIGSQVRRSVRQCISAESRDCGEPSARPRSRSQSDAQALRSAGEAVVSGLNEPASLRSPRAPPDGVTLNLIFDTLCDLREQVDELRRRMDRAPVERPSWS